MLDFLVRRLRRWGSVVWLVLLALSPRLGWAAPPLHLRVRPVAKDVFVHTSYHRFPGVAEPVPANGLIIRTAKGALIVDTAWDAEQTLELLRWVADSLHQRVRLVVVSHAHEDRLAGLALLRANKIKVYSTKLTAQRAATLPYGVPTPALKRYSVVRAGRTRLEVFFPGPGHAPDNIVAWLPRQKVLFGGCLVKNATAPDLGNVADANLRQWPTTVRTVLDRYPKATVVVPGHGDWGGPELLTHTLDLLRSAGRKPQTALDERK